MSTPNANAPWGSHILPEDWRRSIWQKSVEGDRLLHQGKDETLPSQADVVIIGSGLSGASTTYHLLNSPNRPSSIVCLEARELSSGASGRNAGHCRPDAFRGFADYAKMHGADEARKIIASEAITLQKVADFVKRHSVDCELVLRPTVDLILSKEFEEYVDNSYEGAKKAGIDVKNVKRLNREEAQKFTHSPAALGAYLWPAASVNPIKLCLSLHRLNLAKGGYSIFTHNPVTSVVSSTNSDYPWAIKTSKGTILAKKVVYATNAYTRLLLDEVDGVINPCQIQAAKVGPPPSDAGNLVPTMSLRFNLERFYSVASQPDNSIVLGMGPQRIMREDEEHPMDDSRPFDEISQDLFGAVTSVLPKQGYQTDGGVPVEGKGGFEYSWSGIVAFTPDKVPLLGAIPGREGQYMIAGMGGHGMARIFHCAPTLASVMLGGEWDPTLPSVFQITTQRLNRLKAGNVISTPRPAKL